MRVATFNLETLDLPIDHRLAVLRPALERLEADVLCLQEVNSQKLPASSERSLQALDQLLEHTRYADYNRAYTKSTRHSGATTAHNLVTLTRYPIIETRQVWNARVPPATVKLCSTSDQDNTEVMLRFDRPILVTVIDIGDYQLHVINVHLRAPLASSIPGQKSSKFTWRSISSWAEGFYLSGLKRTGQALELRLTVDDIFDQDESAHIVVAGDFNAQEHETGLRIILGAPEDVGNSDLADRSLVVLDRAITPGRRFSVIHNGFPQMLDHILASHALYGRFRDMAVHNEALGDEAVGYSRGVEAAGSYHAACVATFSD